MSLLTSNPKPPQSRSLEKRFTLARVVDLVFYGLTLLCALAIAFVLLWIAVEIGQSAWPAIQAYGIRFLWTTTWNPVTNVYGALPQIYGTLLTAFLALLIAVPVGVGVAVFLSEDFLPKPIQLFLGFAIELIVAIPSVVIGLWGIFVLIPFLRPFYGFLHENLGWIPLFSTTPRGNNYLTLGLVLALMIVPLIISISRGTLLSLPPELRQGAMALGATRWETILKVLIPAGFSGIVGSIMLALGRAMGETMAAAMLVGNANRISSSLLSPGSTIASLIAAQFGEAGRAQVSALLYAGLILMILTFLVNVGAEMIIKKFQNVE